MWGTGVMIGWATERASEVRFKKRYTSPNEDDRVSTAGEQTELKQPQSVRQAVVEMAGFDKGSDCRLSRLPGR